MQAAKPRWIARWRSPAKVFATGANSVGWG